MSPKPQPSRQPAQPGPPGPGPFEAEEQFRHRPVMVDEVVELFAPTPAGWALDATVGGGGHARALLEAYPHLRVLGLDRDTDAVAAASSALARFGDRAKVVHQRFDRLDVVLDELGIPSVSGALFVLHGETRFARRIAAAIVAARPVHTTLALADVVSSAVPAAVRRRGHPAKRVFQALRAAVNGELEVLPVAIDAALSRLSPGGRIVVISYHSGEDRATKDRFVEAASGGCTCPPGLPCVCGAEPRVRLLNRGARKPSVAEVEANPRSESARLRAVEALPAKAGARPDETRPDETRPDEKGRPL